MSKKILLYICVLMLVSVGLGACANQNIPQTGIKVVATTTIVGDIVRQVGGDKISLTVLLPIGADPHTYEPRPQDVSAIDNAQVIFLNGLGLEHSLEQVITTNAKNSVIPLSNGVDVLQFSKGSGESPIGSTQDSTHASGDPHMWMDPNNVIIWVENIRSELSRIDPINAVTYQTNADAYASELRALDDWIKAQVSSLPAGQRKLVTDHLTLGYFARAYGFDQIGLIIASLSSNASPTAQEVATLESIIQREKVQAIFVDASVNSALADQISTDTGVKIVRIYSGSLGEAQGGAEDYLNFMRFNVNAIVNGLK
jgi:ABC-type Zn uptake system ZnuABC Zn-binding protein ZnuA